MVWTIVPREKEPSRNLEVICSLPRNPAARALVLVSVLGRHVARVFGKCEQEEGQLGHPGLLAGSLSQPRRAPTPAAAEPMALPRSIIRHPREDIMW